MQSFAGMDKTDFLEVIRINRDADRVRRAALARDGGVDSNPTLPPPFGTQSAAAIRQYNRMILSAQYGVKLPRPTAAARHGAKRPASRASGDAAESFSPARAYHASMRGAERDVGARPQTHGNQVDDLARQGTTAWDRADAVLRPAAPAHTIASRPKAWSVLGEPPTPGPTVGIDELDAAYAHLSRWRKPPAFPFGTSPKRGPAPITHADAYKRDAPYYVGHDAWRDPSRHSLEVPGHSMSTAVRGAGVRHAESSASLYFLRSEFDAMAAYAQRPHVRQGCTFGHKYPDTSPERARPQAHATDAATQGTEARAASARPGRRPPASALARVVGDAAAAAGPRAGSPGRQPAPPLLRTGTSPSHSPFPSLLSSGRRQSSSPSLARGGNHAR